MPPPKISVYQAGRDMALWEYPALYSAATTSADEELLNLMLRLQKPVYIGIDGVASIAKINEDNDGAFSFVALLDVCLHVADLRKMQAAKVDDPNKVPFKRCSTDLFVDLSDFPLLRIPLIFLARDRGDAPSVLIKLMEERHPDFERELFASFIGALAKVSHEEIEFGITKEITIIGDADENAPPWEFPEERP